MLVETSCLGHPGGTGDDGRLHLASAWTVGQRQQVEGTDRRGGAQLARDQGPPGAVMVADRGDGYRRRVALAVRQQAEVVRRIPPATFPLETDAGPPCAVLRWLRPPGETVRDWHGWCRGQGQRSRVRLLAGKLAPATAQQARRRTRRTAQQAGRTSTAPTLAVAGWSLVSTPLAAATWSPADVLSLSRARWHVARGLKRMQQLLRLPPIRRTHLTSVEATVRALRSAWALHEETVVALRALLPTDGLREPTPVSRWLRTGASLDTVRQQVHATWSEARLRACLPRLRRFLASAPRRRRHQEAAVRPWLAQRAVLLPGSQRQVA